MSYARGMWRGLGLLGASGIAPSPDSGWPLVRPLPPFCAILPRSPTASVRRRQALYRSIGCRTRRAACATAVYPTSLDNRARSGSVRRPRCRPRCVTAHRHRIWSQQGPTCHHSRGSGLADVIGLRSWLGIGLPDIRTLDSSGNLPDGWPRESDRAASKAKTLSTSLRTPRGAGDAGVKGAAVGRRRHARRHAQRLSYQ